MIGIGERSALESRISKLFIQTLKLERTRSIELLRPADRTAGAEPSSKTSASLCTICRGRAQIVDQEDPYD
jgi:hypothetical protein